MLPPNVEINQIIQSLSKPPEIENKNSHFYFSIHSKILKQDTNTWHLYSMDDLKLNLAFLLSKNIHLFNSSHGKRKCRFLNFLPQNCIYSFEGVMIS